MNKTDELLNRLQALEPPAIDNPDELTDHIMQSINAPTARFNAASQRSKGLNAPAARVRDARRTLFRVLRVVTSAAAVWLIGLFFYVYSVPAGRQEPAATTPALSSAGSPQSLPATLQIVRSSLLRAHQPQIISYTQLKKQIYEKD